MVWTAYHCAPPVLIVRGSAAGSGTSKSSSSSNASTSSSSQPEPSNNEHRAALEHASVSAENCALGLQTRAYLRFARLHLPQWGPWTRPHPQRLSLDMFCRSWTDGEQGARHPVHQAGFAFYCNPRLASCAGPSAPAPVAVPNPPPCAERGHAAGPFQRIDRPLQQPSHSALTFLRHR